MSLARSVGRSVDAFRSRHEQRPRERRFSASCGTKKEANGICTLFQAHCFEMHRINTFDGERVFARYKIELGPSVRLSVAFSSYTSISVAKEQKRRKEERNSRTKRKKSNERSQCPYDRLTRLFFLSLSLFLSSVESHLT